MGKRTLNYRIHNPNTRDATADYLAKLFVEVNAGKVEEAMMVASKGGYQGEICRTDER